MARKHRTLSDKQRDALEARFAQVCFYGTPEKNYADSGLWHFINYVCTFDEHDEVRPIKKLPIWDKPATPCLSSRIAYGEKVTPERLKMVDAAERYLRDEGFEPLRVRYHRGDVARIEVAAAQVGRFLEDPLRTAVVDRLRSIGFKYVSLDLEGFRSGSLNAVLPVESLEIGGK